MAGEVPFTRRRRRFKRPQSGPSRFLRDIAPVAGIVTVPFVMVVNPGVPAKTVAEFIDCSN